MKNTDFPQHSQSSLFAVSLLLLFTPSSSFIPPLIFSFFHPPTRGCIEMISAALDTFKLLNRFSQCNEESVLACAVRRLLSFHEFVCMQIRIHAGLQNAKKAESQKYLLRLFFGPFSFSVHLAFGKIFSLLLHNSADKRQILIKRGFQFLCTSFYVRSRSPAVLLCPWQ